MANRTYHQRNVPVHGFSVREHSLYDTWANMHARCSNENEPGYKNYGGRGIKVCRHWNHFENFANDMHPKPDGPFSIERRDNNKGYSKDNCKWATRSEQCVNRRIFKNNTSGYTGVGERKGRFYSRFDFEHIRYAIGLFDTAESAADARRDFVDLFFTNRRAAEEMIAGETLWCTSTSGVRGITPHKDGGYIARTTVNGVRHYLGYFKSIEEASDARTRFLAC